MKRKALTLILACLIMLFAVACGTEKKQETSSQKTPDTQEEKTEATQAETTQAEEGTTEANEAKASDALVVYFSRVGNTDFPADTDALSSASLNVDEGELKGNAQMIAEWIAGEAGCDTFEIVGKDPYPVEYNETVDQARDEQADEARPSMYSSPTKEALFPAQWIRSGNLSPVRL